MPRTGVQQVAVGNLGSLEGLQKDAAVLLARRIDRHGVIGSDTVERVDLRPIIPTDETEHRRPECRDEVARKHAMASSSCLQVRRLWIMHVFLALISTKGRQAVQMLLLDGWGVLPRDQPFDILSCMTAIGVRIQEEARVCRNRRYEEWSR